MRMNSAEPVLVWDFWAAPVCWQSLGAGSLWKQDSWAWKTLEGYKKVLRLLSGPSRAQERCCPSQDCSRTPLASGHVILKLGKRPQPEGAQHEAAEITSASCPAPAS